jgi:putative transposase
LVATDFLTVDAWTMLGLVRYYVLVFIHLGTRRVEIAGITRSPTETWMAQVARNVTMEGVGFLSGTGTPSSANTSGA